jgi:hypothetical protein
LALEYHTLSPSPKCGVDVLMIYFIPVLINMLQTTLEIVTGIFSQIGRFLSEQLNIIVLLIYYY